MEVLQITLVDTGFNVRLVLQSTHTVHWRQSSWHLERSHQLSNGVSHQQWQWRRCVGMVDRLTDSQKHRPHRLHMLSLLTSKQLEVMHGWPFYALTCTLSGCVFVAVWSQHSVIYSVRLSYRIVLYETNVCSCHQHVAAYEWVRD